MAPNDSELDIGPRKDERDSEARAEAGDLERQVIEALRQVDDPELGINIVDLGLVYDVDVADSGDVLVTMTLTSLGCPLGPVIVQEVTGALKDLPGINDVDVKLVWSPPWSPDAMSEEAKDELGIW